MNAPGYEIQGSSRQRSARSGIVEAWRGLTGGPAVQDRHRRTLVACSGGADSCALAIVLAGMSRGSVVLGHVLHDLRPEAEARPDLEVARALANRLGVLFLHASEFVEPHRNAEDGARDVRYKALEAMALRSGCPFIATGHHADDQLETSIMRLTRGTGPSGMRGIHRSRRLDITTAIRPMLNVSREDSESICDEIGWKYAHDATNGDQQLLRNRLRGALSGSSAGRIGSSLDLVADAAQVVADRAEAVFASGTLEGTAWSCEIETIASERPVVIGETLRLAARVLGDETGLDRLGWRSIDAVCERLSDQSNALWSLDAGPVTIRIKDGVLRVSARR